MQVDTKEIAVVKQQATKALTAAQEITIESNGDLTKATDVLSRIKQAQKLIKSKKETITKPINEALKNVRSLFAPVEQSVDEAERLIKSKMLSYQQEVDRKAREEQAKLAKKVEDGKLKPETAVKKMEKIETVAPTVEGSKGGEVQFRTVRKVVIEDESKLPRKYLVPDKIAIRKDALAGVDIEGVKVVEEKEIAAR